MGYISVPASVTCVGNFKTVRRLCNCDVPEDLSPVAAFGSGYSGGFVSSDERTMFAYVLPKSADLGVMTHFWSTAPFPVLEQTIVRYYVDDEAKPSIAFYPPQACGAGFNDQHAPWGTKWFGKGAKDSAWYNNFRIPFGRSIKITVQSMNGTQYGFYIILRGLPDLNFDIGGYPVPPNARMKLQILDTDVDPIAWVPIADFPTGKGLFFMHTLAVQSRNLNFLEGCYHQYTPYNQSFPGTVLSTGTEDYFDSAWYFNAGQFWLPVSGYTHYSEEDNFVKWSAYRFHEMEPMPFSGGFKLHWRNGDVLDPAGLKCYAQTGTIVGEPSISHVTSYAWVYVW